MLLGKKVIHDICQSQMHAFTMSFYNIYADACSIRSIQYVQSSNMNGHSKNILVSDWTVFCNSSVTINECINYAIIKTIV